MQNLKFSFKQEIEHVIHIKPTVNKNIVAWKADVTDLVVGKRKVISCQQGLALAKDIKDFKNGKYPAAATQNLKRGIHDWNAQWVLVPQKFVKEIAKWGFGGKSSTFEISELISKKQFDDVNKLTLILLSDYDHTILDADIQYLPVALHASYLSGNFDNSHYDLKKAHKILSSRKDVHSLSEIEDIPYYNRRDARSKHICFIWSPDTETYRLLKKNEKASIDTWKVIFDLDLLGLRAGGAALFDDYYKSAEYKDD